MQTQTKPRPIRQAPKPSNQARELTIEEKAALWDESTLLHLEELKAEAEIVRQKQIIAGNRAKIKALYSRGRTGAGLVEVCSLCNLPHTGAC